MKKFTTALGLCSMVLFAAFCSNGCGNDQSNLESQKQTAEAVVHASAVGLGAVLDNYQNKADKINFIRDYIDPIRFYSDGSGYF
jgi:hypothetical protein